MYNLKMAAVQLVVVFIFRTSIPPLCEFITLYLVILRSDIISVFRHAYQSLIQVLTFYHYRWYTSSQLTARVEISKFQEPFGPVVFKN